VPKRIPIAALFLAVLASMGLAHGRSQTRPIHWVGTWAASQVAEPQDAPGMDDLRDVTIRQIFHLSLGGNLLRVHLSNAFGSEPLHFTSVRIARPLSAYSSTIDSASDVALKFAGNAEVTVPAGSEYISDPISYRVAALSDLAITFHLDALPAGWSGHPGSCSTSYYVHGDLVSAVILANAKRVDHWYQISGIDVAAPQNSFSIVALGDSITDGFGATPNDNNRWTDVLAKRLQGSRATQDVGVLNEGIGGNRLLTDSLSPSALARFDRDVLSQAGVRFLIVLEGINDLGGLTETGEVTPAEHGAFVQQILSSYEQIIMRAHKAGIKVIGGTILPYGGSVYDRQLPSMEADRQAVNEWIRTPGNFDAVVDFDKITRDPDHLDSLRLSYDTGDHLHPSPAGYRAMGEAISLLLFEH
jgi:lysophospholipase L1-like esterase